MSKTRRRVGDSYEITRLKYHIQQRNVYTLVSIICDWYTRAMNSYRNLLPHQRRRKIGRYFDRCCGVEFYRARGFTSQPQHPGVSPIVPSRAWFCGVELSTAFVIAACFGWAYVADVSWLQWNCGGCTRQDRRKKIALREKVRATLSVEIVIAVEIFTPNSSTARFDEMKKEVRTMCGTWKERFSYARE